MTPQATEPILFHDGTWKGDAMRQALLEAQLGFAERFTGQPGATVVLHNGNYYHSPETVRNQLVPRLQSYQQ